MQISGEDAIELFAHEAGGHRWQRIPPTEKRGRRHTSTITVAVLREPDQNEIEIDRAKLKVLTCRGSGRGGQHKNVTDSAVQLQYGDLTVRCESERSQHQNKNFAMSLLRARLLETVEASAARAENRKRKGQVGSGMRGDKIRTVRVQDNSVKDHVTGKKMRYEKYKRGFVEDLF